MATTAGRLWAATTTEAVVGLPVGAALAVVVGGVACAGTSDMLTSLDSGTGAGGG